MWFADCFFFNCVASSVKHSTHPVTTATQLFSGGPAFCQAQHIYTHVASQHRRISTLPRQHTNSAGACPPPPLPTHSRPCRCWCAPRQLPADATCLCATTELLPAHSVTGPWWHHTLRGRRCWSGGRMCPCRMMMPQHMPPLSRQQSGCACTTHQVHSSPADINRHLCTRLCKHAQA